MKNNSNLSTLSPELQKVIKKEVSTLKIQAQKKPLSDQATAFLETFVDGTWTQRKDGRIDIQGSVALRKSLLVKRVFGKEIFFGKVSRNFDCENSNLTSLEGAPKKVGGYFDCAHNKLTSLEGAPKKVGGDFVCTHNKLTSLEGAPKKVGRYFYCYNNKLTSLEGIGEVKGKIYSELKL